MMEPEVFRSVLLSLLAELPDDAEPLAAHDVGGALTVGVGAAG